MIFSEEHWKRLSKHAQLKCTESLPSRCNVWTLAITFGNTDVELLSRKRKRLKLLQKVLNTASWRLFQEMFHLAPSLST